MSVSASELQTKVFAHLQGLDEASGKDLIEQARAKYENVKVGSYGMDGRGDLADRFLTIGFKEHNPQWSSPRNVRFELMNCYGLSRPGEEPQCTVAVYGGSDYARYLGMLLCTLEPGGTISVIPVKFTPDQENLRSHT